MEQSFTIMAAKMDDTDERIVAALRRDGRAPLSDLAIALGLSRSTVRARMERMQARGDILGYGVILRQDVQADPVRAIMNIGIEGRGTDRILRQLDRMPEVRAVHSTNGRWDVIAELGAEGLEALDAALHRIRRLEGVATSETSLLLRTYR